MGTDRPANDKSGIRFKNSVLYFGRKFWWGVVLSLGVIMITALTAEKFGDGLLLGGVAVAGAIIGTLFSPSPKPADHSRVASDSVDTLLDMLADLERARASIGTATEQTSGALRSIHLLAAQQTITSQGERLARSVENWNSVVPDVADLVVDRRKNGRRRLKQLVDEGTWDE